MKSSGRKGIRRNELRDNNFKFQDGEDGNGKGRKFRTRKQKPVTKNGLEETVINNNNKETKWPKNKIKKKKSLFLTLTELNIPLMSLTTIRS